MANYKLIDQYAPIIRNLTIRTQNCMRTDPDEAERTRPQRVDRV